MFQQICSILVTTDLMFTKLELFLKWNNRVSKEMSQNILLMIIKKEFSISCNNLFVEIHIPDCSIFNIFRA